MTVELETYCREVDRIADESSAALASVADRLEAMLSSEPARFTALISVRRAMMTTADARNADGYLPLGHFVSLDDEGRRAAFLMCIEIEQRRNRLNMEKRLAPYTQDQPLFQAIPGLSKYVRNGDLIAYDCLRHNKVDGEVVQFDNRYAIIDSEMSPQVVHRFAEQFKDAPMWVRLSPGAAYDAKPMSCANEEIVRPANPTWWQHLTLYPGSRDGAEYTLFDPGAPTQDNWSGPYWEYYIRGIRSLQLSCRRDSTRLTVMVEELSYREIGSGMLIGRCMHFDTQDPAGTDASKAILSHLDLALQVYAGDRIAMREKTRLADGKVADASFRAHLFRIEQIPFTAMFAIPHQFFQSPTLVNEWLDNQFPGWRAALDGS